MRRHCEESLRRLGIEAIDLYQFHWPDEYETPVEESWAEMDRLIQEGKVLHGGVSNFEVPLLERCEAIRHVESCQDQFSMVERAVADTVRPWCVEHDAGLLCYSPMHSGQLTDTFDLDRLQSLPESDWRRSAEEFAEPVVRQNLALRDTLRPIAERHGVSVA